MQKHQYIHHSFVPIEQVFSAIQVALDADSRREQPKKVEFNGVPVKVRSLRLRTFLKKGTVCAACGRQATTFAIDRTEDTDSHHLNLWSVDADGTEHLMTHDHIQARALGGADDLANTQTMCARCNSNKSRVEGILARVVAKAKT